MFITIICIRTQVATKLNAKAEHSKGSKAALMTRSLGIFSNTDAILTPPKPHFLNPAGPTPENLAKKF